MTVPAVLRGRLGVMVGVSLACVLEAVPGMPAVPRTLAGLWLLLGAPVALWRGTASRVVSTRDASLMLAVGFAVVTDILVALGLNTVLPLFGDDRPLGRLDLSAATMTVLLVIGVLAPEEEREEPPAGSGPPAGAAAVGGLGALALLLSVAGPIRLNNGFSGAVSTVALVTVAALLVLLVVRRRRYPASLLETGLYVAATALLLLNSLRGWYITGHDIQREYKYFRLTLGGSLWDPSTYVDAYNACLSVTLLPVSVVRLTAVPDLYVFKALLPLLFALTPVLVYRSVRNVAPQFVALLSAVYFMVFPTFFSDMTFLGRQEVAFLLLGCSMVVLTDPGRPLARRRWTFSVLMAGVVLSHYSTTYVVVATLGIAFAVDKVWRLAARSREPRPRRRSQNDQSTSFVTWWMVLLPAVLALLWAGPVTGTSGQLQSTLRIVAQNVLHPGQAQSGSSDTSYSLLGGTKASPEELLAEFREESIEQTESQRAAGAYMPLTKLKSTPTPVVAQADLPVTGLGKALEAVGIPVPALNGALRQGAALLLQLLVLVGFVVVFRSRSRSFRPARDQVTLTAGALAVVALFTLLPQLSVDYSVLRAFQQGLFFFAPFVAAGTLWALRWANRRTVPLACVLTTALFLDLTGVVPKVLGGYPAQLQLSNAGRYYDIYYPHAEERQAAFWLAQRTANDKGQLVQTDRYGFSRLQTLLTGKSQGEIFPTFMRTHSYVLLGTTAARKDEVTVFYRGDLITYRYPMGLLDATKNQIYSSEGARIYR
ncbi:DUF2206 domain-containing protein [Kitasatospora terrestris]|uniref:DUF2206 domain-containing protein n=1 Tax=Kitasatospora terrestris TaxID=258051 RepID=A0ABP9DNH5_9ACTN